MPEPLGDDRGLIGKHILQGQMEKGSIIIDDDEVIGLVGGEMKVLGSIATREKLISVCEWLYENPRPEDWK